MPLSQLTRVCLSLCAISSRLHRPRLSLPSSVRERKPSSAYAPPSPLFKDVGEFLIEPGVGARLGSIANIEKRLEMTKSVATELKQLHYACFPNVKGGNVKATVKKHLREFSGYPRVCHTSIADRG